MTTEALKVSSKLCCGCARDLLDGGGAYGPGDLILLVDPENCECTDPSCDHVDHEDDGEEAT